MRNRTPLTKAYCSSSQAYSTGTSCTSVTTLYHLWSGARSSSRPSCQYLLGEAFQLLWKTSNGRFLLSLLGFNIARHALELYFGRTW